jgi:FeS assembly SUF system protein
MSEAAADPVDPSELEPRVIAVLKTCYDPEIPVDIYELGLIYGVDIDPTGFVDVTMTLTSPGCPVAGSLPGEVEEKVRSVPGVRDARVTLVWEPMWHKDLMSDAAKLTLGFM